MLSFYTHFRQLSDSEFKSALIATLNLKKEWMASNNFPYVSFSI